MDVVDRLVLGRRALAGVSVDLTEFGRRRASRGPRGRRRLSHLLIVVLWNLWPRKNSQRAPQSTQEDLCVRVRFLKRLNARRSKTAGLLLPRLFDKFCSV